LGVQVPVLQELVAVQTCRHAPQFDGSAFTFTHLPPQQTVFGDWQIFPQVPQFSGSDFVFMHVFPQYVNPIEGQNTGLGVVIPDIKTVGVTVGTMVLPGFMQDEPLQTRLAGHMLPQ
jgi:hypothetical protein